MPSKKEVELRKESYYKNGCYYNRNNKVVRIDPYGLGVSKYTAPANYEAQKFIKGL